MRCENCNVDIKAEFTFSIKNNQCPACGKQLMKQSKLSSYMSLVTLLNNNFTNIDVDKISTLIVANFELKQLFKEEISKDEKMTDIDKDSVNQSPQPSIVVEEEYEVTEETKNDDPDYDHKQEQMREAKAILKRMRDEALASAQLDRYSISGDTFSGLGESDNPIVNAALGKIDYQRQKSSEAIDSGIGGAFKRSDI